MNLANLVIMAAVILVASFVLALPPVHKHLVLPVLLAMREAYIIWPLRLITGRRKPDYARIRELEIECGIILDRHIQGRACPHCERLRRQAGPLRPLG